MQHDADVIGTDARGFCDLLVGEVLQEKGDERFFEWVQFVDGGVKIGDAVVRVFFRCLPRFNRARRGRRVRNERRGRCVMPACGRTKWRC